MSRITDKVHPWHPRKNGAMVVVIPKPLRDELGIRAGDELSVKIEGLKIIYSKVNP